MVKGSPPMPPTRLAPRRLGLQRDPSPTLVGQGRCAIAFSPSARALLACASGKACAEAPGPAHKSLPTLARARRYAMRGARANTMAGATSEAGSIVLDFRTRRQPLPSVMGALSGARRAPFHCTLRQPHASTKERQRPRKSSAKQCARPTQLQAKGIAQVPGTLER